MRRLFPNRMRLLTAISVIVLGGLVQTRAGQAYCRSEFYRYFEGLGAADARVNPVERFIFSLLLTKTKSDGHTARLTQGPTKQL
jgi:hypothetical protein